MPSLSFTPNLLRLIDAPEAEVEGATVGEALAGYFAAHPQAAGYVLDEQGAVRKHVAVFVNGAMVPATEVLARELAPADRIYVAQALSGG